MKKILAIAAILATASVTTPRTSTAQQSPTTPNPGAQLQNTSKFRHTAEDLASKAPKANPDDVSSPEAIVAAAYSVISGPKGARNWDRFRSLCLPTTHMGRYGVDAQGNSFVTLWTVEDFITEGKPILEGMDFYESSIVNHVDRFGNLAQVFSSYASRHEKDGQPFSRGINSWQLIYDGKRWWIASLMWDAERPGLTLPQNMEK